ncbi:MAG: threonine synthase [Thermoproteota archaeon]|uniref:Threonine synthase n=1 Tax=Candidatus Methanodesulfokora washburnensis TaxID=2478471 RepID=A0A520KQ81_9CREN|nr:MAG: threonine synthase [Candidatus Methanodesulfokores washburnensis]TDA40769.1 MAG: threonine synthase [Candidatus Korarchaeota archaeon]
MHLRCVNCNRRYEIDEVVYSCNCGGLLEVVIDLDKAKNVFDGRDITLWKYRSFLPVDERVSLREGGTPIYKLSDGVYLKNEGANPTGSFKDRGMTVGVSKAVELGMRKVICASTGNTAASLAAYSAKAGMKCYVLVPSGKVAVGKLSQAIIHGANIVQIKGNFDDALNIVLKASRGIGAYILNSVNPFRLEGQKTAAFEIYDQLRFVPDTVILPVGNGGNISAIWKGFKEMEEAGIINKLPKMVGIQAEGASPLVRMFKEGGDFRPFERPETVATAIRIGNPVNWTKAIKAVRESNGLLESVTDDEILEAQEELASVHGIFVEPASAASLAGFKKLRKAGAIRRDEKVVLVATGHGLKDPDAVLRRSRPIISVNADANELIKILEEQRKPEH